MASESDLVRRFIGERSVHLCIDMQNLFAEDTPWHNPWLARILPQIEPVVAHAPDKTIFTRFVPPADPSELPGRWQDYYRQWASMTRGALDPALLSLVPALRDFVPPAATLDKARYSAFAATTLAADLRARNVQSLIITGGETDICVLATVLDAVDLGFGVVLPLDALCSSSDSGHDAVLTLYAERFSQQIAASDTASVLRLWQQAR